MRGLAAEFRASFDEMARQSELDELRREVEALRTGQVAAPIAPPPSLAGPAPPAEAEADAYGGHAAQTPVPELEGLAAPESPGGHAASAPAPSPGSGPTSCDAISPPGVSPSTLAPYPSSPVKAVMADEPTSLIGEGGLAAAPADAARQAAAPRPRKPRTPRVKTGEGQQG
jgi:sec-independent protein translocase protein TatB